jgi:hypothetical protein
MFVHQQVIRRQPHHFILIESKYSHFLCLQEEAGTIPARILGSIHYLLLQLLRGVTQGVLQGVLQGVMQGVLQGVMQGVLKGVHSGMAQRTE